MCTDLASRFGKRQEMVRACCSLFLEHKQVMSMTWNDPVLEITDLIGVVEFKSMRFCCLALNSCFMSDRSSSIYVSKMKYSIQLENSARL